MSVEVAAAAANSILGSHSKLLSVFFCALSRQSRLDYENSRINAFIQILIQAMYGTQFPLRRTAIKHWYSRKIWFNYHIWATFWKKNVTNLVETLIKPEQTVYSLLGFCVIECLFEVVNYMDHKIYEMNQSNVDPFSVFFSHTIQLFFFKYFGKFIYIFYDKWYSQKKISSPISWKWHQLIEL